MQDYLRSINGNENQPSNLEFYHHFVAKEKAIAACVNMLSLKKNTYIGFIWCPVAFEPLIKKELMEFPTTEFESHRSDYSLPHEIQPPTYFKNNDVTATPQLITNTYGVPSY